MTIKEQETLKKLLAKEKEEKQQLKKMEQYRQAKNAEDNLNNYFYLICENLELKNFDEEDLLLTYLLSEKFKDYFLKKELKRDENSSSNGDNFWQV